jgi:hypothetical protein
VTGLAQPERLGIGDDARRAAEGERLLAVRYAIDGGEPVTVEPALVAPGTTVEAVLSVPADTEVADLVVDDAGVQQRLSLLTGAPGDGNVQVLARPNRGVELNAASSWKGR